MMMFCISQSQVVFSMMNRTKCKTAHIENYLLIYFLQQWSLQTICIRLNEKIPMYNLVNIVNFMSFGTNFQNENSFK
jgi:hypothetical protein